MALPGQLARIQDPKVREQVSSLFERLARCEEAAAVKSGPLHIQLEALFRRLEAAELEAVAKFGGTNDVSESLKRLQAVETELRRQHCGTKASASPTPLVPLVPPAPPRPVVPKPAPAPAPAPAPSPKKKKMGGLLMSAHRAGALEGSA